MTIAIIAGPIPPAAALAAIVPHAAPHSLGWLTRLDARGRSATLAALIQIADATRSTTGYCGPIGAGHSVLVAQVAAQVAAHSTSPIVAVPRATTDAFLAPLPVTLLPIAPALAADLAHLGIDQIGQLARLTCAALGARWGGPGLALFAALHGPDAPLPSPIRDPRLTLGRRLAGPLADRLVLQRVLADLADRLALRLDARGAACGQVGLALATDVGTADLLSSADLATPSADAATLAAHAYALLDRSAVAAVTRVALIAADLRPRVGRQATLFDGVLADPAAHPMAALTRRAPALAAQLHTIAITDAACILADDGIALRPLGTP